MLHRTIPLAIASALTLLVPFLSRSDAQPRRVPPAKLFDDKMATAYMGTVTAVTGEMLTIKPEGDLKITRKHYGPNGATTTSEYVQDNTKPPRTFVFNDELLFHNGTLPSERLAKGISISSPHGQHKIADLRVGDVVLIECRDTRGVDHCISLEILRRPGGKVPPAIGDDTKTPGKRIADQRNARQWIEETLIPGLRDAKIFPNR